MTFQEAECISPGARVAYRGKITEVLSVDRGTPAMIYFRLAGVGGRTSYARVMPAPAVWHRAPHASQPAPAPMRVAFRTRSPERAAVRVPAPVSAVLRAGERLAGLVALLGARAVRGWDRATFWSRALRRTQRLSLRP
jgi:hypothetical protein